MKYIDLKISYTLSIYLTGSCLHYSSNFITLCNSQIAFRRFRLVTLQKMKDRHGRYHEFVRYGRLMASYNDAKGPSCLAPRWQEIFLNFALGMVGNPSPRLNFERML